MSIKKRVIEKAKKKKKEVEAKGIHRLRGREEKGTRKMPKLVGL